MPPHTHKVCIIVVLSVCISQMLGVDASLSRLRQQQQHDAHDIFERGLVRTPQDICDNNGAFTQYDTITCHNATFIAETQGTCDGNGNFDSSTSTLTSCASYSGNPSLSKCHDCQGKVVCSSSEDTNAVCPNNGEILPCAQLPGNNYWAHYGICLSDSGYAVRREFCDTNTGAVVVQDFAQSFCAAAKPFCHKCGEVFFCEDQQYGCSAVGLDQLGSSSTTLGPTLSPSTSPTQAPTPPPTASPTSGKTQQQSTNNGSTSGAVTATPFMWAETFILLAFLAPFQ